MILRETSLRALLLVAILCAGGGLVWLFASSKVDVTSEKVEERQRKKPVKSNGTPVRKMSVTKPKAQAETAILSEDEKLSDSLQDALQRESVQDAVTLSKKALLSTNDDVRAEAVTVLGWFGTATLSELTAFLSDPNDKVRADAFLQWKDALGQLESEETRAKIITMTCRALKDPEMIREMTMELVGMDDRRAVDALSRLITSSGAEQGKAAREAYKFMTGEDYRDKNTALAWIREREGAD